MYYSEVQESEPKDLDHLNLTYYSNLTEFKINIQNNPLILDSQTEFVWNNNQTTFIYKYVYICTVR